MKMPLTFGPMGGGPPPGGGRPDGPPGGRPGGGGGPMGRHGPMMAGEKAKNLPYALEEKGVWTKGLYDKVKKID